MIFSNSYFRAFVLNLLMFVGVLAASYQRAGLDYISDRRGNIFLSLLGISLAINVGIVGTFSRGGKPWPWLKTGLACLGCWAAIVFAIGFLVFVFTRPR